MYKFFSEKKTKKQKKNSLINIHYKAGLTQKYNN